MRYLVVAAQNDDGYGKAGIDGVYAFASREEAEQAATHIDEFNLGWVMTTGGYPGQTRVVDTQDEDSFDDFAGQYESEYEEEEI